MLFKDHIFINFLQQNTRPSTCFKTHDEHFQILSWAFEALRVNQKLDWEFEMLSQVFEKLGRVFKKLGNMFGLQHDPCYPKSHHRISKISKIYLGHSCQYTAMSNGYADAMIMFTKILKQSFSLLQTLGHQSVVYIDDTFLVQKKVVLFLKIGCVKISLILTRPHSWMCITIHIFNFKKQQTKK